MTIEDLHLRAVVPVPFRVCGVSLLPMTVGHARILEGLGIMHAIAPVDLMTAAWVCSRPPGKFAGSIGKWWVRAWFGFWRRRLGRKWNWANSAAIWADYVEHHLDEPMATTKGQGGELRSPWLAHLRSVCCGECGYDPATFDNTTLAQATIDYHAFAEREGRSTLMPNTVSQIRQLRRLAC